MANPKDILVITTATADSIKIQKYLKPVSAHIVAGTNLFSDFLGGLTDVFGGRSLSYQKQLTSLYNEAIEQIKIAAYEIGANCVIGLSVDMDEISGKGKSMFMLTAIGTAVILEKTISDNNLSQKKFGKLENVSVERINILRTKKEILEKAIAGNLNIKDEIWDFITSNQVDEIFPYLVTKYSETFLQVDQTISLKFHKSLVTFIEALPELKKLDLLYSALKTEKNNKIIFKLSEIIKELYLFDFEKCMSLLQDGNFETQKIGLRIVTYDKPFYNREDIEVLRTLKLFIENTFSERGVRSMKKQLLSSKEKEIWTCECGKSNDVDSYCSGCHNDIYGFKSSEVKPLIAIEHTQQKINLIEELIA